VSHAYRAIYNENSYGKADRVRLTPPPRRQGAHLAPLADGAPVARNPRALSDPFWFQAFGCGLGFDAGTEWSLFAVGGKGAALLKSPAQIATAGEHSGRDPDTLVHASRTGAALSTGD
jgi:hypothetical protein